MGTFRIILVLAVFLTLTANTYGSERIWSSSTKKDEFTNETRYTATGDAGDFFTYGGGKSFSRRIGVSFGIRCDVSSDGEKQFMLTFRVDEALDTPSSPADVFLKVDDNAPFEFSGRLFSNSYRSGYVPMRSSNREDIEKWVAQGIAGYKMSVRVQDERRSEIQNYPVLLTGFTKHTAETLHACNVSPRESSMRNSDRDRLKEIESQIQKLERERSKILSVE